MPKRVLHLEMEPGLRRKARTYRICKAAILARYGTVQAFADAKGLSRSLVSLVMGSLNRSLRVEQALADLAGVPLGELFPPCSRKSPKKAA